MTRTLPTFLQEASRTGGLTWNLLLPVLSEERRFVAQRSALLRWLTSEPLPACGGIEAAAPPPRPRGGLDSGAPDPLQVYWMDLRRIAPTSRQDEFALARAIDLMRAVLLRLLERDPSGAARAVAFEHLSPYSPVLEALQHRPGPPARPAAPGAMDLLHLRLHELLALQQTLVTRNLHLVPAAARRYSQFGVPWEDLIQEGNAALLRAVERYDRREGVRFAHYATWWIQQGILKALSCQARTVRLPVYLAQLLHRVRAVQAGSAHPLAAEEIARRTRVRVERVQRALAADRPCLSLDRSLVSTSGEDDADASLSERIADARPEPEPGAPGAEDLRRALAELLDRLPSREARILRLRFGLDGERPRTLEEVRAELGVSRERVRQLQAQSLRRLSQAAPRRALARFL